MAIQDLFKPGQVVERLTVVSVSSIISSGRTRWRIECKCVCGETTVVDAYHLRDGNIRSCGCLRSETTIKRSTKHGNAPRSGWSYEYGVWNGMLSRCLDTNCTIYKYYGGRGITVDPSWKDFKKFLADVGPCPKEGLTLDRKNNNLGYVPGNCRWVDWITQQNNRRSNRKEEYLGRTQTVAQWAHEFKLKPGRVFSRLYRGWDLHTALTTPLRAW